MAKTFYDQDADLGLLKESRIGIIGYGSQGHAHALNLRDSGLSVKVGLRPDSSSVGQARSQGLETAPPRDVAAWADVIMILTPDPTQPALYREQLSPHLEEGQTLMFSHGFNIRYGTIQVPSGVDVSMVAPKAPGHRVRETYLSGEGTPGLLAIHQDATGKARQRALAYAKGLGCTRAGVIETTFAEETETDLFGEQAVLCGGVSELVKAGFETLVEAGYQPEVAYFECLHELKLIVDLMYRGGLNYMRYSVSDTAEYGDYTAGPRVIDSHVRETMQELLKAVRDGSFARQWVEEYDGGAGNFKAQRRREQNHLIEQVGSRLRRRMSFLDPVEIGAKEEEAESKPEKTPA